MLRDYVKGAKPAGRPTGADATAAVPANPLRELQAQWGKMLTRCYELYAEGKRCVHEEDPLRRLDCTHCGHREAAGFCRANFLLKRLVGLIAEYLAERKVPPGGAPAPEPAPAAATGEAGDGPPAPLTQAQLDEFKAQGVCYEVETPLCPERVWIVPRRTGKARLEFTPDEIHFMSQAARALDGALVEIRRESPSQPSGEAR